MIGITQAPSTEFMETPFDKQSNEPVPSSLKTEFPKLGPQQLEQLRATFKVMDANGDGVVSREELKTLLAGLG